MKLTGTVRQVNRLSGTLFRTKASGGSHEINEVVPEIVTVSYVDTEAVTTND